MHGSSILVAAVDYRRHREGLGRRENLYLLSRYLTTMFVLLVPALPAVMCSRTPNLPFPSSFAVYSPFVSGAK